MGQHVAYRNRFPAEAGYFTADSIPEYSTSGLRRSRDERRIVADYDNAVRYNDRVVGEILDRCRTRDAVASTSPTTARRCSITPTATDASTMRRSRPTAAVTNTRFPS